MDWRVLVALSLYCLAGFVPLAVAGRFVVMALVDVAEWLVFQLRNPSRESVLSFLKGVLWFLGILAYGWGATRLSYLALRSNPINDYLSRVLPWEGGALAPHCLWVGLLAVAAWQVRAHGHRTAGSILTAMAVLAALFSAYDISVLATGWEPNCLLMRCVIGPSY